MKYVIVSEKKADGTYRNIGLSDIREVIGKDIRWICLDTWKHRYRRKLFIYLKQLEGITILDERETARVLRNKDIPYRIYNRST